MSLFEVKNLSVAIGDLPICSDLNFSLDAGQHWGILGGNGVGKTTLLNSFAGLGNIESGEVIIKGEALQHWKRKQLAQHLGVLFQDSVDTFPSTVMETAIAGRYAFMPLLSLDGKEEKALAEQALGEVSLKTLATRQVDTLSGGERRRLALATLLVQNPQIWLLDEPTNHLDLHHQISLLSVIQEKVKQKEGGLIMVLHDVNLVMRFCTHAMLMIDHEHIICGTVDEVVTQENLTALYKHPVSRVEANGGVFFYPE